MAVKSKKKKKTVSKKKVIKRKQIKKKPIKKKIIKKKPVKKAKAKAKAKEKIIGVVTHYFPHVNAAVIKLKAPLLVGDSIKIKGHTTDLIQRIDSMQIDRVAITSAKKGDEIGVLVVSRVRQHDVVCKA